MSCDTCNYIFQELFKQAQIAAQIKKNLFFQIMSFIMRLKQTF